MEGRVIRNVLLVVAGVVVCAATAAAGGQLRAWGSDAAGQVTGVPAGDNYVAIAAGDAHGLALRSDGTVIAWGQNNSGECSVPAGTYRAIAAGADFSLAIRTNGSLAAWGRNADGVISNVPAGSDFVAVEGGESFAVALRANGSIVAWGNDRWQQVSGAPKGTGFMAVAAGDSHAVALRSDGTLVSWGYWAAAEGMPTRGTYTAIGAGGDFCVALRSDGSLVWWGADSHGYGISKVPAGDNYTAVAAGYLHAVALRKDGSLVGWGAGMDNSGNPNWGQARPPTGGNYVAVACGLYYSVALTDDSAATTIADNFNDSQQGSLWRRYGDDPANCWLDETHQRLELRATARTRMTSAYYISNAWQIDPTKDFSFKVDFHYGLRTDRTGRVSVGLTPDMSNLQNYHVEFGSRCSKFYPHVWFEALDGVRPQVEFADRPSTDGVLYVSYEAAADKLYLSTTGYRARNAWAVVPDLLQAAWVSRPLWLYLGGGSDGQEIKSGDAYLDNFVFETGLPATPASLRSVHRFWSPILQQHFYTLDPAEVDKLIRESSKVWTHEGPVFRAAETPDTPGLAPVYRFWSTKGAGHFYTIDPSEESKLGDKTLQTWVFEGVAFYAYPEGQQPPTSKPVYRFWHPRDNNHFYTMDTAERDRLIREYGRIYTFEGVAFYAFE